MSTERRYTEEEIAAIFEKATETQKERQKNSLPSEGLTLAELQKIGHDLGLPADVIAQSVTEVTRPSGIEGYASEPTTTLGVDVSANYSIDLPAALSDQSWEKLVVDVRHVFNSQGNIIQNGSLREWKTDIGDIEVMIEPTDTGQRLRIKSINANVQAGLGIGAAMSVVLAAFIAIVIGKGGDFATPFTVLTMLMSLALFITFISPRFMPEWKKKRNKQMQDLGARALKLAASQTNDKSTSEIATASVVEKDTQPQISLDNLPDPPAENTESSRENLKDRA